MTLAEAVVAALTNDLRQPQYRWNPNPLAGHCYVASEAFYHLSGKPSCLKPMTVRHEGYVHWWLRNTIGGVELDLTADQFATPVPYHLGRGRGFLTRQPSKRAKIVIDRVCQEISPQSIDSK